MVDDIKSGARKIGSDDYAPGTCKAWKSFIGVYESFDPLHQFGCDNIDRASSFIVKKKVEDHEKAVEIYLTESELQAFADMELTGFKEQVRDIFLVGCYTSQRVSDYNNLNKDQFETTRKGNRVALSNKRPRHS